MGEADAETEGACVRELVDSVETDAVGEMVGETLLECVSVALTLGLLATEGDSEGEGVEDGTMDIIRTSKFDCSAIQR